MALPAHALNSSSLRMCAGVRTALIVILEQIEQLAQQALLLLAREIIIAARLAALVRVVGVLRCVRRSGAHGVQVVRVESLAEIRIQITAAVIIGTAVFGPQNCKKTNNNC